MRLRPPRGQAVVEMALSVLVFVTILVFGIHFAEVGYLSLKATEGASSALWDATGMRAHRFTGAASVSEFYNSNQMKAGFPLKNPEQRANAAYKDFDGRAATSGGAASSLTHVFTRARNLEVDCRPEALAVVPATLSPRLANLPLVYKEARAAGRRVDGMSCNASAELQGFNLPRSFFEKSGGGYFKAAHYRRVGIGVCAFGRPRGAGGPCEGRVSIALGDWGLAGTTGGGRRPAEWQECRPSDGCQNQPYWRAVEALFVANGAGGGNDASALARLVTGGSSPANENAYHMVFKGEYNLEPPMHHRLPGESGSEDWAVSPATGPYDTAYQRREQCFLGMSCSGFL